MYWELLKDFFGRKEVKSFLFFSIGCYVLFILLCMFTDIDFHKKKIKNKKNKEKLNSQKQKEVSKSEV